MFPCYSFFFDPVHARQLALILYAAPTVTLIELEYLESSQPGHTARYCFQTYHNILSFGGRIYVTVSKLRLEARTFDVTIVHQSAIKTML